MSNKRITSVSHAVTISHLVLISKQFVFLVEIIACRRYQMTHEVEVISGSDQRLSDITMISNISISVDIQYVSTGV